VVLAIRDDVAEQAIRFVGVRKREQEALALEDRDDRAHRRGAISVAPDGGTL